MRFKLGENQQNGGREKGVSRRQQRARRVDLTRQWRDGIFNENAPNLARWSREMKPPAPKVIKKAVADETEQEGTIIQVNRRTCSLINAGGKTFSCHYSPKLNAAEFSGIAVGDRVRFSLSQGVSGFINRILPRKNQLSRNGPEDRKNEELVLAANIDRVVVVFSFTEPRFDSRMLDRYLVRIQMLGIEPIICINKRDIPHRISPELRYLKNLGISVIHLSAETGYGMQRLMREIKGKWCVLTGPSGVGKSSIVNYFKPDEAVRVGDVRFGKGCHVTTCARSYPIAPGTWIIDTPGLREMVLRSVKKNELASFFPDFREYAGRCMFRDCLHISEKGCGVLEALHQKHIPGFRHESYLRFLAESES